MNQLMLVIIVFVAFVYFGGSNVPKVLRDNKEMLLGVVVGIVLYSFLGMRLEGINGEVAPEKVKPSPDDPVDPVEPTKAEPSPAEPAEPAPVELS